MPPKFPGPYLDTCNEQDPIMERVPFDNTGIGARKSGTPNDVKAEKMTIDHVGGTAGGKR